MVSSIQFRGTVLLPLIVFASACFGPLPKVQAVSPAPDGGYASGNTAEGQSALLSLTTGGFNTAIGFLSLRANTTNSFNTAVGAGTLPVNTADSNTATGAAALLSNTTGSSNTAYGVDVLGSNTTGSNNVALGFQAGLHQTTGSNNIYIGAGILGDAGENHACHIASIFQEPVDAITAVPVLIDVHEKLGTMSSSRRFKHDIKPMDEASESILALKPVMFRYNSDTTDTPQFGLIAEEVAGVNPNLVVRDNNGEILTVRYDQVNAMLLNEFLKAHRRIEEQDKRIEELSAQLRQQAAQIERVSAQLAVSKPPSQPVANND